MPVIVIDDYKFLDLFFYLILVNVYIICLNFYLHVVV